jgi:hypothetical protein
VETYDDVRAILQQPDLFNGYKTVVIDNATVLQDWAVPYVLATVPLEKGGKADNILSYGWNKGYQYLYDAMKLILTDCDALVSKGFNIIVIAQSDVHKVPNSGGEDFLREGPRLHAGKPSIEALYCEWANHIFMIAYSSVSIRKDDAKKKAGKADGDTTRIIRTQPEIYFRAKTRQLKSGEFLPPAVSFEDRADDSLWQLMFNQGVK